MLGPSELTYHRFFSDGPGVRSVRDRKAVFTFTISGYVIAVFILCVHWLIGFSPGDNDDADNNNNNNNNNNDDDDDDDDDINNNNNNNNNNVKSVDKDSVSLVLCNMCRIGYIIILYRLIKKAPKTGTAACRPKPKAKAVI